MKMRTILITLGFVVNDHTNAVKVGAAGNTTLPYGDPRQPGWPWRKVLGTLDAFDDINNGITYRHCEDHALDAKTSSLGFCQSFNYGYDFELHVVLGGNIP